MAESILVTGKKISSMELVTNMTGNEKIPTGQPDDLALTPNQIADHTIVRGDLASQEDLSQVEVSLGTQITDLTNDVNSSNNSIRGLIAAEEAARIAADNLKVDKEGSVSSVAGRVGNVVLAPSDVLVEGFGSQEDVNKYVPKPFLSGYTYGLGERVVLNDGEVVKSLVDGNVGNPNVAMTGWVSTVSDSLSDTVQTFTTPEAGVDPVTGVADGAYFNVRSSGDESYADEYQNVGGSAVATGKSYPSFLVVDILAEKTSKVDAKLKRENVSVWDFFTAEEYATYKLAPTVFDAYRPIQEFLDYLVANDVRCAFCSGEFAIGTGLQYGAGSAKTKLIFGNASFKALNAIDTVLKIQAGSDFSWMGMITVIGTGGTGSNSYNSRTCRVGVQISSPSVNSPRNRYTAITVNNFKEFGVFVNGVGSLSSLGFIRSSNCGSGKSAAGYSLTSNFSNPVNSGSSGSVSQLTVLDVATLPSEDIVSTTTNSLPLQAIINGTPYYVQNIDRVNNKITIFPWIEPSITSGTLTYMFGGAVCVNGGDSSVLGIEMIDAVNCGTALVSGALYPPVVERIVSQFNGCALKLGQNPASAMIGGSVGTLYCENNDFDLIRVTRASLSFNILNTVAFNLDKVAFSCAARVTSGNYANYANLRGISLFSNGVPLEYQRAAIGSVSPTLDVTDENNSDFVYFGGPTSPTITINIPNDARASLFGIYKRRVIVFGSAAGSRPQPITFTLEDSVNYTINGTTSVLFDSFEGFAVFEVIYDRSNKRFLISQVSNKGANTSGTTSVTYDPPSIPADGIETTTVTLTGAAVGDIVQAAFSRYDAGIEISAVVSSANTVTVRFKNVSAAPINLASGTLKVKLV